MSLRIEIIHSFISSSQSGSDGTGSKKFDQGQVRHFWIKSRFGKFPLKIPNFSTFSLWVKKISWGWVKKFPGQPLIYSGSKVCLGWVKAQLYSQVALVSQFDISFWIFVISLEFFWKKLKWQNFFQFFTYRFYFVLLINWLSEFFLDVRS